MSTEYYSGIECLQRAAKLLDRPVDMLGLLSSPPQSQPLQDGIAQQLARLAIEQRFNAIVLEHVAQDQIAHCPYPMLIHVMSGRYSTKPDYYTLCLGVSGGDVNLFSPSLGDFSVPLNQLESDRRAEAIVLSPRPLPADARFLHHALPIAQYTIMLAIVLSLAVLAVAGRGEQGVSHFPGAFLRMRRSCVQLLCLAIAALVLTFVCRLAAGGPFCPAAPTPAGQPIDFLLPPSFATAAVLIKPPEISVEAALRLARTDAIFVDARDANEYNAGHIRGAILCPAADIDHWRLHMAGIDPHARIIVYCAQASCGKGAYVATFLLKNGFTNVVLYRDGWAKWTGPREAR